MAKRITDVDRIVGFFHAHAGEPEADTIYQSIKAIYRARDQRPAPATKPARKRRGRPPKAAFVQAQEAPDA